MLDSALRESDSKVFVAHLNVIDDYDIAELKLGKKATEAATPRRAELHKQLDRYAYGGPRVRFSDEEVDQARAAGVTIEFEHGAPLIVDRSLYRELVKQAIARTVVRARGRASPSRPPSARPAAPPGAPSPRTRWPRPSATSAGSCASAASRRTASTSTSAPACSTACRPLTPRT